MDGIHQPVVIYPEIIFKVKSSSYQGEIDSFEAAKSFYEFIYGMLFVVVKKGRELLYFISWFYEISFIISPAYLDYAVPLCKIQLSSYL